jgi:hypothetical protein
VKPCYERLLLQHAGGSQGLASRHVASVSRTNRKWSSLEIVPKSGSDHGSGDVLRFLGGRTKCLKITRTN